jgi:hypothetical protein
MIEIYECTDCKHCASFAWGYRVFCLHPDLKGDAVVNYAPVNDYQSADKCDGFDEGRPSNFSQEQLVEAEKYGEELTYESIRAWCLAQEPQP